MPSMIRLAPVVILVAACGGGTSGTDAPSAPDAAPDAISETDAAPPGREGIVTVQEWVIADEDAGSLVGVTLFDGPFGGGPIGAAGECTIYQGFHDTVSAGDITITGTTVSVTASPDGPPPYALYPPPDTPADLFATGASITIAAAGDASGAPAFSGTVTAPAPPTDVTFPDTVSLSSPVTVTWAAGSGPGMDLWVFEGADATGMRCRIPDTGSFTIPAAALAMLPVESVGFSLFRVDAITVTAGDMEVELQAASVYTAYGKVPVVP